MKIYVTLTDHCIKQIIERNPKQKNKKWATAFWINLFTKFIKIGKNKWRKVRMSYQKDWKYRITDWVHQFIFAKPFKIEYILITYVKRKIILWEDLRHKERFI